MVMGNGSPLDSDAILTSVNTIANQLDEGFRAPRFRHTQHDEFTEKRGRVREARVTVAPGIHQDGGYFDIQWWENGDYTNHYREKGLEFRFGREASNQATDHPVLHFHPPDELSRHEQSCISETHPPELVTLAVLTMWWAAVTATDEQVLNTQSGLP
ncbi:hypothetical protein [Halobaculum roseum]|uniref:Uncharacterized protein n=1 Tax=Halobaculum roseum TaxID=2175149 RepID=A0ABD5MNT7_9EURY|nr:hypothetical protein [Halobaculum roseum]